MARDFITFPAIAPHNAGCGVRIPNGYGYQRMTIMTPIDILVVDSVRLYHQIIEKVFAGTRLRPHFAETGEAALDRVASGRYAIVCGALHLPDMDGIELCRRLRRLPQVSFTPFILLTSNDATAFQVEAYTAGVTDVFEKQSLLPLVTMLQRLLAHREPVTGQVLVVEDARAQASFFVGVLETVGLACDVTASAEEALGLLGMQEYDLVLMDIVLPGHMSGVTLANQIRRLEGVRGEVPILAATAFDDLSRRIELFHLGVDDYVIKPVVAEELTARARNLIGHYRLLLQTRAARSTAEAQREEARRELAYRAGHDALTGLANRWVLEEKLAAVLNDGSAGRFALALIDISALRMVNDACGHEAGDALMREMGRRLATIPAWVIARLEGARIGVLVAGDTAGERGEAVMQVLETIEAEPFIWSERHYAVRPGGGALLSLTAIGSVTEALARVETAAAAAHASGTGGLLFYDAADERIAAREREKSALGPLLGALDDRRLALFMQRISPLAAGRAEVGHEFLCRLVTPEGRLVVPGEFMPAAERYGLMPRLDRIVTALAFDWIAAHGRRPAGADFFTINLSGQTVGDLGFVDFVRERLTATGAPAQHIYFEITETAVVADPDSAAEFMARLADLGCRFALDDFGSGSASYGQLKQLPVQLLKIDGLFVTHLLDSPLDRAIVRSACDIARALGLPTVAEFVENEEQLALLRELGVDYVQGYAIDRPGPAHPVSEQS